MKAQKGSRSIALLFI